VTIVDDAQAELGRATQRLADSRAALANASGSSALSLLSASVAPPLARVSDAAAPRRGSTTVPR
jgi:hypothetical protein